MTRGLRVVLTDPTSAYVGRAGVMQAHPVPGSVDAVYVHLDDDDVSVRVFRRWQLGLEPLVLAYRETSMRRKGGQP